MYLIETKAVHSCISSSFLFSIGIVHYFDTVNHLDTVERLSSHSPASSFPGLRKAELWPRNEAMHSLDFMNDWGARVPFDEIWCVVAVKKL